MDGDFYIFENNRYRQGFLYKTMVMSAVMSDGVKPTLGELEKFEASVDDAELEREKVQQVSSVGGVCVL